MISTLKGFENNDPKKPTKFVMFACLRKDNQDIPLDIKFVKTPSVMTLQFASDVTSTVIHDVAANTCRNPTRVMPIKPRRGL